MRTLLSNELIVVSVSAWLIAQIIKSVLCRVKDKKWDYKRFYESGGMPSAHSAFVSSLTYGLACKYGISSDYFTIALALSLIVMYDAMGVRYEAGKHAKAINSIQNEMKMPVRSYLNEKLGHRPAEVFFGAVLGVCISAFAHYSSISAFH